MHLEFEAPETLKDTIRCFWYDSTDHGTEISGFDVTPDGYAEIIFHFGSGCNIMDHGSLQALPSPFIVGLLNQPVTFYTKDRFEVVAIRCFPWTVFDLLGLPSDKKELHILAHPIARLQETLQQHIDAGNITEAIGVVKQYFLDAREQVAVDSMLSKAGVAMRGAKGAIPVSEVASAAHASKRTLERKFKQSSGHTVKDVAALMRFEQARNRLWTEPGTKLAGLAYELGYTDQAHLSREFKRFSGTTPAAFARKTKQRKQAISSDFVAFVQD